MAEIIGPLRFMDGLDAGLRVEEWIEEIRLVAHGPSIKIERFGLRLSDPSAQPNGGLTVVWVKSKLFGIATIVRDDMNFSVLTITQV